MTAMTTEQGSLTERAENMFRAQLDALGPLESILQERKDLKAKLAEIDIRYGEAYSAAEATGWSVKQLAALGAEEPAIRPKRGRGRPRKSPVPVQSTGGGSGSPTDAPSSTDASGQSSPE